MATHIVIPDTQIKPGVPTEHLTWIGKYIVDQFKGKPDVTIIHLGDNWDMPSLSSYDKGKKRMEGQRYAADIEAGNAAFKLLDAPLSRQKSWKPRKVFLTGNHECVDETTRAFTRRGFVSVDDLVSSDEVLSVDDSGEGIWQECGAPHIYDYDGPMVDMSKMMVTPNHRVVGLRKTHGGWVEQPARTVTASNPIQIFRAARNNTPDSPMSDIDIRLAAWAHTDSGRTKQYGTWTFYQRAEKAQRPLDLLTHAGLQFSEYRRDRESPVFPNGNLAVRVDTAVDMYLGRCPRLDRLVPDRDRLSPWVWDLSERQVRILLDEWVYTDGSIHKHAKESRIIYCSRDGLRDDLQRLLTLNGFGVSATEYRPGHWRLNVTTRRSRSTGTSTTVPYKGKVWCLTVPNGRFFVERQGHVFLTGNSRIERAAEDNAQLEGTVSLDDCDTLDWDRYAFLEPVNIDSVRYCHYFYNPINGRPISGMIETRLKTIGHSFTQGHQQVLMYGLRPVAGTMQHGLVAGLCTLHDEDYLGPQGNASWRGIVVCHEVRDGHYDPMMVSLDYLCRRYEGVSLKKRYPKLGQGRRWVPAAR